MNTLTVPLRTACFTPPPLPPASSLRFGAAVLAFFLAAALILFPGCQTTTTDTAARVLVSAVQSVDAAMQGWAHYVALGKATPAQETAVYNAYVKYQRAESAAQTALLVTLDNHDDPIWTQARDALTAAQKDLLQLVDAFTRPSSMQPVLIVPTPP